MIITPRKNFKVSIKSNAQWEQVQRRAFSLGYSFENEDFELRGTDHPLYLVFFTPSQDNDMLPMIKEQRQERAKGGQPLYPPFAGFRIVGAIDFLNAEIKVVRKRERVFYNKPLIATKDNDMMLFDGGAKLAVNYLKENGFPKASRFNIYMAISSNNVRKTAYGYKWRYSTKDEIEKIRDGFENNEDL